VLDALATLPPRARTVVVLRFWQDLSVEQAADMLGCSVGNVKSQSARALGKLRALLEGAVTESGSPGRAQTEQHQTGASEMDETTLRELLDHALIHEPPIGPVAHNARQAGLRLRRQRRLHRIAGSMAAIAVIAAIIPIVTIGPVTGRATAALGGDCVQIAQLGSPYAEEYGIALAAQNGGSARSL
jgi:Sigma-70, region 4